MPISKAQNLHPIVLAIPDPRLHHNFAGASFTVITQFIYTLAQYTEDWSWTDGFLTTDMEKIETSIYNAALSKEKSQKKIKKDFIDKKLNSREVKGLLKSTSSKDINKHKIIILKTTQLTNYHYIQDHIFSIKPLYLKNM